MKEPKRYFIENAKGGWIFRHLDTMSQTFRTKEEALGAAMTFADLQRLADPSVKVEFVGCDFHEDMD